MRVLISGLNLEKLLREAQESGIALRGVRRVSARGLEASVSPRQLRALYALCDRFGWTAQEVHAGAALRAVRGIRRRWAFFAGMALCALLVALSSQFVLRVDVQGAQEYAAEVRRFLLQEGAAAGALKRRISFDVLRQNLLLRLPGISYAGFRYAGSVLEVECRLALDGETVHKAGESGDLIACEAGVVTRMAVQSGTPLVQSGDAVHAGQVLVKGEERSAQGGTVTVKAQAQVFARVWAKGEARTALTVQQSEYTGKTRTRVTLLTPFFARVLREAAPFEAQETDVYTQEVIGLFIPLEKRTEIYREIHVKKMPRDSAQAASFAQGAAEKMAKKQVPAGALILDKWVDYSMIDNEFLYASVVIEYEKDVAVRAEEQKGGARTISNTQ